MISVAKNNKCNQCGDTFLQRELRYKNTKDGAYCVYCVKEWFISGIIDLLLKEQEYYNKEEKQWLKEIINKIK